MVHELGRNAVRIRVSHSAPLWPLASGPVIIISRVICITQDAGLNSVLGSIIL